jgi:glycine/D-amino acid oxidase-like deaminating enzyme
VILDHEGVGAGMTERTTAHLTAALDHRYYRLERTHHREGASLAAESHTAAIDDIAAIVTELEIDCAFERLPGYLFAPPGDSLDELQKELEAARRSGLGKVDLVERAPFAEWDSGPCLVFPDQAQMHPLHFLEGLLPSIVEGGGRLFRAHVHDVHGGKSPHVVTDNGYRITAQSLVLTTHTPIHQGAGIHTKQAPYTTYAIAMPIAKGSFPHILLWDTAQEPGQQDASGGVPYHYVRRAPAGPEEDLLIVGGEDHRTGQAQDGDERFRRLEAWTRARFSVRGDVAWRWSGMVMEPVDGLAFIGQSPKEDNVFLSTGASGNGMTHGVLAGRLLSELVQGRSHRWAALYDPARTITHSLGETARRAWNAAAQYGDYLGGGEALSEDSIAPRSGAVVRQGLTLAAVYVDASGRKHKLSAVCPHMKCIVHWNPTESTWDCPCHGSRFAAEGAVIMGPARDGLKPID